MSMQREYKISLSQEYYSDVVYLSQYDNDYQLKFKVVNKYANANINGILAKLTGTRPDLLGFTFTSVGVGSNVTFNITRELTAVAGAHTAEIIFYDANDMYFGSANIQIIVEPAAHPEGTIDADEEELRDLAQQCQDIVDNAKEEVEGEAERWAVGTIDGVPVESTDPAYHNNAKYYSEQAATSAASIVVDSALDTSSTHAIQNKPVAEAINTLNANLNILFPFDNNTWSVGYVNSTGTIVAESSYSNYRSPYLYVSKQIIIIPQANRQVRVAYYNKQTKQFVSASAWSTSALVVNNDYDIILCIATTNDNTLTAEQVFAGFTIFADSEDMSCFVESVNVEDGWGGSGGTYPQTYYVHAKHLDIASGITIHARSGYQIAIADNQWVTKQPWGDSITTTASYTDAIIIVRRTGSSGPIDKTVDGLTLYSYVVEAFTSVFNKAYVLNDAQISYIKATLKDAVTSKWQGKKTAFVGDSITEGTNTTTGNIYYQLLNTMIGFSSVYADGVAGSGYSATGTDNYTPIVDRTDDIPTDCDLVVIFAGTNDFGHSVPIGDITDTTDVSFYGAVTKTITDIITANPTVRLVILTPLHRSGTTYRAEDTPNDVGKVLADYVDALRKVCDKYSIPIIDMYAKSGMNPNIPIIKTNYITDGLHPNNAGHLRMATLIYGQLEAL